VRPKKEAYASYVEWCHSHAIKPTNFPVFNKTLKGLPGVGFDRGKNNRDAAYLGFVIVRTALGGGDQFSGSSGYGRH
jgi:hypothetical protein